MPIAPRSLAAAVFGSPRSQLILGGAVTLSVVALQLLSEIKPWDPSAPVELSNQLVALTGFAWCAIQFWTLRREAAARRAWSAAGLAMLLLVLEDNIGRLFPIANHALAELATIGLWLIAAGLVFACGRLYAMRRSVTPAMRTALTIQLTTQGFVLAAILTAPLRAHGYVTLVDTVAEVGELMAALTYVGALLMTSFAPVKSYRRPISEIGRKAREIFTDFRLEKAARYPTPYRVLHGPVVRDFTFAAMALLYAPHGAASARQDGAASRLRQIAGMIGCAAKGVDPVSYFLLGLYRPGSEPDAVLTRTETKNGLTSAIQKAGRRAVAPSEMSDKLDFWRICEASGVASAPILGWFDRGSFEIFAGREAFDRDLFVKDRRGRGGKHTLVYDRVAPFLYREPGGALLTLSALLEDLSERSAGRRLILQPKLASHTEVADFAKDSLVVFRLVTCLDERDEPQVTHGVLRVLRRFEPSWPAFPENEWGAAIELKTGELGQMTGDVVETCGVWHDRHPVTAAQVAGRVLASWPALAEAARGAHRVFRSRALVGWDIAMTPEGPVILEGNSNMDFCFVQRCYRTPVGLSPLGPLLDWRLDRIVAARTAELGVRAAGAAVSVGR
jgi:hypothetical protein